jgi:hypothetical protein
VRRRSHYLFEEQVAAIEVAVFERIEGLKGT